MKLHGSIAGILMLLLLTENNGNEIQTGVFVDDCVVNSSFSTSSGLKGRTNSNGEYFYREGDTITFTIGDKKLGETEAGQLTSVLDFQNYGQVAQLLQAIDNNGNPDDCIQISDEDYEKISSAPFEISEVDSSSTDFQEKFKATFGYSLPYAPSESTDLAFDAFKEQLIARYDYNFLWFQYEWLEFGSGLLGANANDPDTIFGLNPNYFVKTPQSRLRLYFYWEYARKFLQHNEYLYRTSAEQRKATAASINEKSRKYIDTATQMIGLLGLSNSTSENALSWQLASKEIKKGPQSGAYAVNQLSLFVEKDTGYFKELAVKTAIDSFGDAAFNDVIDTVEASNVLLDFPGVTPVNETLKSSLKSCVPMGQPTITDLGKCLINSVGEAALALNTGISSYYDIQDIEAANAARVANEYLQLYYLFDANLITLQGIFCNISDLNCTNVDFDEDTELDEALDGLASELGIPTSLINRQYKLDLAKSLIQKNKNTVSELYYYFTKNFDTTKLQDLEPHHIKTEVLLEPTTGVDQYKACLKMTNPYFPLADVNVDIKFFKDSNENEFFSDSVDFANFANHSESQTRCSSPFTIEFDSSFLNPNLQLLKVTYGIDYILAFREQAGQEIQRSQEGEKYFEISKQTVIDDLTNPIIKVNISPSKYVAPGTEVTLDASGTLSLSETDTFSYTWTYLDGQDYEDLPFTVHGSGEIVTFTAPNLPSDKSFYLLYFNVVASSNNSGKESTKNIVVVVKEQEEVSTVTSAGQVWMDRNLGASRVATSSTDTEAYGDLYQWGRGTDGHEKRNSPTTSTLSTTDSPGHGSFITASSFPYDWRSPQNDNLWQGVSGTNNPCPSGFRLPTETELETERVSWSSNDSAGAYGSPLKLVVAGDSVISGTVLGAGSYGYYWSSTVNGTVSRDLNFGSGSGDAGMGNGGRADGFSVRCLED